MSKRVNNRKGKLGRSPKFNKHISRPNGFGTQNDIYSPYRKQHVFVGLGLGKWTKRIL